CRPFILGASKRWTACSTTSSSTNIRTSRIPGSRIDIREREGGRMEAALIERLRIREVVQNWAVWRDAGDWERFRSVWHPEGRMMATWFQGPAERFIEVSREGFDKGVSILHFLGGSSIDVAGSRAIAQTKMSISQRATVDEVA